MVNFAPKCLVSLSLFLVSLLYASPEVTFAQAPTNSRAQLEDNVVVIINQVRGKECCQPGSIDQLQRQIQASLELQLPMTFALRYDALKDNDLVSLLKQAQTQHPDLIYSGIFLEITPQLATAAAVPYSATADNWHQAHHSYSVGYAPTDAKKMMDELVSTYQATFATDPEMSVGWITDTSTINYLHQTYGIKVHELTREQWGTDSYTLEGGPPHYPYFASHNWSFIPQKNDPQLPAKSVLIIRQTLTDPVFNYGDPTSAFTSQPNDFTRDGKSIEYFYSLFNQAMSQPQGQPGFAVIGLENSMTDDQQSLYNQQLQFIAKQRSDGQVKVLAASDLANYDWSPLSVYTGSVQTAKSQTATWITTPTYRIRLRTSGREVFIDDFRLYDPSLIDPYTNRVAQNQAYWIAPFLLNGSRFYTHSRWDWQWPFVHRLVSTGDDSRSDITAKPQRLQLPLAYRERPLQIGKVNDVVTVNYITSSQKPVLLRFAPDHFSLSPGQITDFTYINNHQSLPLTWQTSPDSANLAWKVDEQVSHQADIKCEDDSCTITPTLNPDTFLGTQATQPQYYFPQRTIASSSASLTTAPSSASVVYLHNRFAMAGRNPIRLVIIPRNPDLTAAELPQDTVITTEPELSYTTQDSTTNLERWYYFDFAEDQPQQVKINVKLGQEQHYTDTMTFAPDCKQMIGYCLAHPRQTWWFLQTLWQDKIAQRQD